MRRREHIWVLLLVGLTLWPVVHWQLTQRVGVSAWKLAGWGMYSEPHRIPQVQVLVSDGGPPQAIELGRLSESGRVAYGEYVLSRSSLGRWAKPDDLADAILRQFPTVQRLRVVVRVPRLDRTTSTLQVETIHHDFQR